MKLTTPQKSLLNRELHDGIFVILTCAAEDRVAINLSNKGLGFFTNFRSQYPWRRRSGYYNHFTPSDEGRALRS